MMLARHGMPLAIAFAGALLASPALAGSAWDDIRPSAFGDRNAHLAGRPRPLGQAPLI